MERAHIRANCRNKKGPRHESLGISDNFWILYDTVVVERLTPNPLVGWWWESWESIMTKLRVVFAAYCCSSGTVEQVRADWFHLLAFVGCVVRLNFAAIMLSISSSFVLHLNSTLGFQLIFWLVRCIEDKHYSCFAVPDIQLNLLCKNWIANCSCKHTMSQVREKAEKKVTNLTAIPITEGFLCNVADIRNLSSTPYLGLMTLSLQLHAKGIQKQSAPENDAIRENCGLMIPPSVMGLQSLLAHSLVTLAGTIHPATHTWRFEKKVGGGNLSLKMLKKHSRWWKNSLSEFQLGFQIRFLKLNLFAQIKLWQTLNHRWFRV